MHGDACMFSPRLNELVRDASRRLRFDVADVAPDTFQGIAGRATAGLVVWSGASERTIFGDPAVNWGFRALHDALHLQTGIGFDPAAEIEIGRIQAGEIARVAGDKIATLVWLETAGQAEHYLRSGGFVADQIEWTRAQLARLGVTP
jgi:hypothetical protein